MSQIFKQTAGGGGGGAVDTLTPDFGGVISPVGGNINVFGQKSLVAQSMDTLNTGGTLFIEDRTWFTPYVVDANATIGLRGTFSTIQAAINQAQTDGVVGPIIMVRRGGYVENPNITSSQFFYIIGPTASPNDPFENANFASILGTLTVSGGASVYIANMSVTVSVDTQPGTSLYGYNSVFNLITASENVYLTACVLTGIGSVFSGNTQLRECAIGHDITLSATAVFNALIEDCYGYLPVFIGIANVIANNAININYYGNRNLAFNGNTTGNVNIQNNSIAGNIYFPNASTLNVSNIQVSPGVSVGTFSSQIPTTISASSQGNVAFRRIISASGNVTNNDQYVGCRQSGALALSLVNSGFVVGQIITFKDESGTAGVNNITITPTAGTIDGGATYVMSMNYQAINIIFDGSNFFIF